MREISHRRGEEAAERRRRMDFGGLTRTRDGVFSLTLAARAVGETPSQDPDCILHHHHRRASLSLSLPLVARIRETTRTLAEC